MSYKDLYAKAEEIIGEPPDIELLTSQKYVVMYMNFNSEPPPQGDTPEEALSKFLEWHKGVDEKWKERSKGVEHEA